MRPFRKRMQIVFQDPFSSLNPRMSVRQIIEEGLIVNGLGRTRADRALPPPIGGWRSDEMSANRPNEASATTCLTCRSLNGRCRRVDGPGVGPRREPSL